MGELLGPLRVFNLLIIGYFVLLNGFYLGTTLAAFRGLRRYARRARALDTGLDVWTAGAPPITVIVPTYEEAATCVAVARALLALNYPRYEVLLVDDGSTDGTPQRLIEAFDLEPAARATTADLPSAPVTGVYHSTASQRLWLLTKENGGKSDALNAGLNYCQTPLFCGIDGDTLLERDALMRAVRPFLEDGSTVAAGGVVRVVNGCRVRDGIVEDVRLPRSWLARLQVVEYLRGFLVGRIGWDSLGMLLIVSGAFGLFRRSAVVEVGGFATTTVGEDMELVVRLHRRLRERGVLYRITFVPDPVAWTEVPEDLGSLRRQRDRWQRGLMESLWLHRRMFGRRRYGSIGLLAFPYFGLFEMLGPLLETLGYVGFGIALLAGTASTAYVLAFLALAIGFGTALSVAALALEELTFRRYGRGSDLGRLFAAALLENMGYRQLVTLYRAGGIVSAARRVRSWGTQRRRGFADEHGPVGTAGGAGAPARPD